jgi:hypothetical protein
MEDFIYNKIFKKKKTIQVFDFLKKIKIRIDLLIHVLIHSTNNQNLDPVKFQVKSYKYGKLKNLICKV